MMNNRSNNFAVSPAGADESPAGPQALPSGTVTFLFTDIEGSTRLSQEYAADMPRLLARHHAILNAAIANQGGFTFNIVGDSFAVAFHSPADALAAALDIQRNLLREDWSPAPVKIRIGIHTGAAELTDPTASQPYDGYTAIATAQRLMSAGHGGQILISQAAADLARNHLPPEVELIDMRERVLRDIVQPVRIYQVIAPDLPSRFAPLRTADVVRHNLPAQTTTFVGRERELTSLTALLTDNQKRLITLVAPGGMGKTRLAQQAAGHLIDSFPQGVFFVALDRISSADQVVGAVVAALPISLSSNEPPESRILDYLGDKHVLIVMDNFEHVLDGASFVRDMLTSAPNLQILATSRERLNLTAETVVTIEGLSISERDTDENSAIQLFVQSARHTQPDFQLGDATLPAVRRICLLVDGMPLAIVLAAAWIDTLSVEEIETEITRNLDILETELNDIPARQRSVRAVIESSWGQVDPASQELLSRLSVFRGGFSRDAAQSAAGATLRGLSQLVSRALVRYDPVTGRYTIHELLRQFASQRLQDSDGMEQQAHDAHAAYFADLMDTIWQQMRSQEFREMLPLIQADLDNIGVAWNYWTAAQNGSRLAPFIGPLWIYHEIRGSFTPAIDLFGNAATLFMATDAATGSKLRAHQAWFTALIGEAGQGLSMAQDSITVMQQAGIDPDIESLQCLTINAIFLNRNDVVDETAERMMHYAERHPTVWNRGWANIWWAYALVLRRDVAGAMEAGQESLRLFDSLDSPYGQSVATGIILGAISMAIGDVPRARDYYLRGAHLAESINYLRLLQITYDNLGTIALIEGDPAAARQNFLKSLRVSQECGQNREMLSSLRDLASVSMAQGDPAAALRLLAVILNNPASDQNALNRPERLRDEAEKLRVETESQLDPTAYAAAWSEGQMLTLANGVATLLA